MITTKNGEYLYFDRHGRAITDGCKVRYPSGTVRTVYLTESNQLGIDATNPYWIETGRAAPCEYGIYPFTKEETEEIEVVD